LGSSSPVLPEGTKDGEKAATSGFSAGWGQDGGGGAGVTGILEKEEVVGAAGWLEGGGAWLGNDTPHHQT
jgi:hypothetical protein